MPDPAPIAAPADAGATSATPPPAAPSTDPNALHPAVPELMRRLLSSVDDDPPADPPGERRREDPKPPEKKEPEAKLATAAPDKPIKVRQPKTPERPALPVKPVAAAPAAAAPSPSAEEEAAWEKTLEENEREMIEEARFAEANLPTQHAGLTSKVQKFLREHEAKVNEPDFDPDSQEYKNWLNQHQPRLTPSQQRAIQETRIAQRVQKEADSKIGDVRHEMFARDQEPTIKSKGQQLYNELVAQALPKEVLDAIKADAGKKPEDKVARKSFALEMDTAHAILQAARDDLEEFNRITTKNPDTGRPIRAITNSDQHQRLSEMVKHLCMEFRDTGGAQCIRNGKWFVTRDEFHALPESEKAKFWTFTNSEIITRARAKIPAAVKSAISAKIAESERLGFKRVPYTPPAPAAAAPAKHPGSPPAPRPSSAPSGSSQPASDGARLAAALNGNN